MPSLLFFFFIFNTVPILTKKKNKLLFKLISFFTMSLYNLKSNWQSVMRTVFLNYHLACGFIIITMTFFFLYLSLVVWYLMVSNLHSTFSIHWTNPSYCGVDLSKDCGFLKSTIVIWVDVRAILKTGWEVTTGACGNATGI